MRLRVIAAAFAIAPAAPAEDPRLIKIRIGAHL
jgi:hypothetical protein